MKKKVLVALFALVLILVGVSAVSAGEWLCFPAGPDSNIHCIPPGKAGLMDQGKLPPSLQTQVFHHDTNDFLGTEMLLREDIYNGQPCPQDHLEEWELLDDIPYYACHHYDTGHHG